MTISFDILIYALGYETRAQFVATNGIFQKTIALKYPSTELHSYDSNLTLAIEREDTIIEVGFVPQTLESILREATSSIDSASGRLPTVCVDVSSLDRRTMAATLKVSMELADAAKFELSFAYSPAKFRRPPAESEPVLNFAPLPGFEGWTANPELPVSAIVGLGYEQDISIGAVEFLDPSGVWTLMPVGRDDRFQKEVIKANSDIWSLVPEERRLHYHVFDPSRTSASIINLCTGLIGRSRVVIVPTGPKIFGALCLVAQRKLSNDVSVWRASQHSSSVIADAEPDGEIVLFKYSPIPK
ncbi:hypothetical protein NUH88_20050 [Nisaea acidiphila]|uniref:Uncharacterized protein n=1 Tax=Nisaea acidiphila TaxID=1862145 RepID=A0A9J7AR56_9PROT|nr:hypothetical protein [Nisaea acidiphila]UUX49678.1 hypothetical protein NUH88_20050 [Nisaea acidiphila]